MRFSKIANLGNAPAIHDKNIVVKTCQSPPAAHHQPTEPTQSLCPVRACVVPIRPQSLHMVFAPPEIVSLPPISPQSTLLFNVIYQNREKKTKSVETNFTWLRLVLKKMRFSKIANLVNAPAIHNQEIVARTFQSPPAAHQQPTEPTQSLCPVRACLAPIIQQSPHMVFTPSKLIFSPSAHRVLCYSMLYIKTVKKKRNRLKQISLGCGSFEKKCGFQKLQI